MNQLGAQLLLQNACPGGTATCVSFFFLQEYIYMRDSVQLIQRIMETAACMGNNIIYVVHKNELRS